MNRVVFPQLLMISEQATRRATVLYVTFCMYKLKLAQLYIKISQCDRKCGKLENPGCPSTKAATSLMVKLLFLKFLVFFFQTL
jgi:hypothetical protein